MPTDAEYEQARRDFDAAFDHYVCDRCGAEVIAAKGKAHECLPNTHVCSCGKVYPADQDPHQWKPPVTGSAPDDHLNGCTAPHRGDECFKVPDDAVEAACEAYHDHRIEHGGYTEVEAVLRAALAAAYPALTRQAVAAERERADALVTGLDRMLRDMKRGKSVYVIKEMRALIDADNARIVRAEPETTP